MPTWPDEIAKGCVPYHQLTVEDFRIDDQAHPDGVYWVSAFIHPYWNYITLRNSGWWYAYVEQWLVHSGFDKNTSSRKSTFHEMKRALPHVQAYLDIYEIYGRQFAALKPGELPSGRGATPPEAIENLNKSLDAFLKEKYKPLEMEAQEFQKATNRGANTKKVIELGQAIRKRLEAIPAPTDPPSDSLAPAGSPSASPQPSATPAKPRGLQPPG